MSDVEINSNQSSNDAEAELKRLLQQQEALVAKIEAQRTASKEAALANVKSLITTYGFTQTDLRTVLKAKRVVTESPPVYQTLRTH